MKGIGQRTLLLLLGVGTMFTFFVLVWTALLLVEWEPGKIRDLVSSVEIKIVALAMLIISAFCSSVVFFVLTDWERLSAIYAAD